MGWLPPDWCPSGTCRGSRPEGFLQPQNAQRGLGHTGAAPLALVRAGDTLVMALVGRSSASAASVGDGDLAGERPHTGGQFAGAGNDDWVDRCAPGPHPSGALAEAYLRLPPASLERRGDRL